MFGSSQQRDRPEGTTAMIRIVLPAAIAIAAIAAAAQAQTAGAVSYTPVAHQTVRFHDLDLSSPAGARRLAFRIRVAARELCGAPNTAIAQTGMAFDPCVKQAVEDAAARLDNPSVTAALGLTPTAGGVYAGR
jgi:UrcA family protein